MKRFLAIIGIVVVIFVASVPIFAATNSLDGEINFYVNGEPYGESIILSGDTNFVVKQTGNYINFGIGTTSSFSSYQSIAYNSNNTYSVSVVNDDTGADLVTNWSVGSGFSNSVAVDGSTHYVVNIDYVSNVQTYSITFNSNGGSSIATLTGLSAIPTDIQTNSSYKPTKANYAFAGWYRNSSLTTRASGGTALTGNITLYAKWTAVQSTYSVTYHDGNYSWTENGFTSLDSASLSSSKASYHDSTQYSFSGWYYDSSYTQIANVGDVLTQNIDLFAKLDPVVSQNVNLSIYFNGTLSSTSQMTIPFVIDVEYMPSMAQMFVGHSSCSWVSSLDVDKQYFVKVIEGGTSTVYVQQFEIDTSTNFSYPVNCGSDIRIVITTVDHSTPAIPIYEISFDSNRGNAVSPLNSSDGKLPTLPNCVRYGFRFDGWYYDSAFTEQAFSGDVVSADTVLYAKWTFTGDPEELTADPGNVLRGMFTGMTESGLTVFLTVGNHIGFGGITIISVLVSAGVILVIYFVIKIIRG
ncbi:MAG: InlB B-repeat-containing protein [Clostridia bacterium]|nr:InlB B-repeat-containing protein [Clostridia bacterium]